VASEGRGASVGGRSSVTCAAPTSRHADYHKLIIPVPLERRVVLSGVAESACFLCAAHGVCFGEEEQRDGLAGGGLAGCQRWR
jgi:hypothetical protein